MRWDYEPRVYSNPTDIARALKILDNHDKLRPGIFETVEPQNVDGVNIRHWFAYGGTALVTLAEKLTILGNETSTYLLAETLGLEARNSLEAA